MAEEAVQRTKSTGADQGYETLDPSSHTAERLKHASHEHLHLTTRRFFIGPIPEGWLNSHRKSWYKRRLELSNYSSKTATFAASTSVAHQRQLTGLEGPSATAMFGQSFPQPDDADEDTIAAEDEDDNENDGTFPEELEPVNTAELPIPQILGIEDPNNPPQAKSLPVPAEQNLSEDNPDRGRLTSDRPTSSSPGQETFVTAHEDVGSPRDHGSPTEGFQGPSNTIDQRLSTSVATPSGRDPSPAMGDHAGTASSTASLINHGTLEQGTKMSKKSQRSLQEHDPAPIADDRPGTSHRASAMGIRFAQRVGDQGGKVGGKVMGKVSSAGHRASGMQHRMQARRNTLQEGAVVKVEKMLVRIDTTIQEVSPEFDENDGQKIETQLVEKWREYMVVVRQNHHDDADFRLQFYKSRVIPTIDNGTVGKKCQHEVYLDPRRTRVNLYSSLDKTVVLWHPHRKGTRFFIMRPRSTAHSVEWYTFLRDTLGHLRPSVLVVNVPDLSLTLRLENPFRDLEATRAAVTDSDDEAAVWQKTMVEEQAVAGRIIRRCLEMLEGDPEWSSVLETWSSTAKMGLAWKRYDRLEWVHGVNEQKMYGSMAMRTSHELELRPKEHYPLTVAGKKGKTHQEPLPLEGFLIRLTSQRGMHQRFGKMFFKRLYFTTQNHFLVFCRPARTSPPHPPRLATISGENVPSASEIVEKTPLMFNIEPYPLEDGQIKWLKSGNKSYVARHDREAYEEQQRNIENLTKCDGYINMCRIVKVRNVKWGATPVDDDLEAGSDVDFHQDVPDNQQDDGTTQQIDDDRIFEIVLDNGLIVRLQAYNEETKKEWVKRLRELIKYWKLRTAADSNLFKAVRQANLDHLKIDEEMEAVVGQFARKWEVLKTEASPQLYHMCGIGCCRPITMSGLLYRKPRRHSTFVRCGVILTDSKLLIFQGSLRTRSGAEVPHIHQERQHILDLGDCYVYSGLITEDDLLYQNQTFDSNHPGLHALPRVYLHDGWTSRDQDSMTCFVLWHGLKKSFFRAEEENEGGGTRQRLRQVSRLGVPGRSMVFKCRSRAERDHWVMSIGMEIDRLQQGEDVRLESQKK